MKKLSLIDLFEDKDKTKQFDVKPIQFPKQQPYQPGVGNPAKWPGYKPYQGSPLQSNDATKNYNINQAQAQPQQPEHSEYEDEGFNSNEVGGNAPWMSPDQYGRWQKSQIPNSPEQPGLEDFSNSLEQDSPTAGRTGPLRPQPQMQANPLSAYAKQWSPNAGVAQNAKRPLANNEDTNSTPIVPRMAPSGQRKPMKFPK